MWKGIALRGLGPQRARPMRKGVALGGRGLCGRVSPSEGSAYEEGCRPRRTRPMWKGRPSEGSASEGLGLCTYIRSECASMTELETKVCG